MYLVYPDPNQAQVFYQTQSYNAARSLQNSLTLMGYEAPSISAEAEYEEEAEECEYTFTSDITLADVREATGLLIGGFVIALISGAVFYLNFFL